MNYYRELLRQSGRIEPFRRAVRALIQKEDLVLEVGTGLGTYSFFAAEAGAARVWAVEGDPVVHVAEMVAKLNGYTDKIDFIRGWIPEVSIPERATVLIFEDFPPRFLDARTYRLLAKLRDAYLTKDARFLPSGARLFLAPVEAESGVVSSLLPVGRTDESAYGIDWTPTREYVANTAHRLSIPPGAVKDQPALIADISLTRLPTVEEIGGTACWKYERDAHIGGIAYWFDLVLPNGECISNAPGASPGSWGQLLLPVDPPLGVSAGETIELSVSPERLSDGAPGWFAWWAGNESARVRGHEFAASPAAFSDLYGESPDAVPRLSARGMLESRVLHLADGARSVSQIARELARQSQGLPEYDALQLALAALKNRTVPADISNYAFDTEVSDDRSPK